MERGQKSASEMKVKRGNTREGPRKGAEVWRWGNRGGWRGIEQNEVCVLKLLGNL